MNSTEDERLPLTLLTGFLGSGKTTLLNRLLQHPGLSDTAVIINEFGEIGLDHLLVDHVSENLRVLNSGCLCCTVRGDLIETLGGLESRRARGEIRFSRVIVETTGLADPAPVLHTLMVEPGITRAFRLAGVVTTVDAVNGAASLDRHREALKQAAMADVLLLTKTDIAVPAQVAVLLERLQAINPGAAQLNVVDGELAPEVLLACEQAGAAADLRLAFDDEVGASHDGHHAHHAHHAHSHPHDLNRHDDHIRAHCFVVDAPVAEAAFTQWLALMAAMRGDQLLRVKGLVWTHERPDEPLVVHGVQHVFHPPQRLAAWPTAGRRTQLVFITDELDRAEIARTFLKFAGLSPAAASAMT